jgi:hypothetical protein
MYPAFTVSANSVNRWCCGTTKAIAVAVTNSRGRARPVTLRRSGRGWVDRAVRASAGGWVRCGGSAGGRAGNWSTGLSFAIRRRRAGGCEPR